MKTNIYKDKIIKILSKNHLLSISEIHEKIPEADYSTIYRNIEKLVADREFKKVILDKDKVMYEINNKKSKHDHFVCVNCGLVDELYRSDVKVKSLKNYYITDVLIRGLCQKCN